MPVKPYEESGTGSGGLAGMLLLKPGCRMRVYQPSYTKGHTLIRPWSTFVDGGCMPWRDEQGNFGTSFFVADRVCHGWGIDARITCFADVLDESNWPGGSPVDLFFQDIRNHPDFKYLLDRTTSFSPLSAPKYCGFIKGVLLANAGKPYQKAPQWGVILQLSASARAAFEALLNKEGKPINPKDTENDPYGWNAKYVVGDPVGLECGKVFEFAKESAIMEEEGAEIDLSKPGTAVATSDRKKEIEDYACRIYPKAKVLKLPAAKVQKYDCPFEEAFNYLTGEEQIRQVLIPAFGRSARAALLYTFGGKDILPSSYENARKTVDMAPKTAETATNPKAEEPPVEAPDDEEEPEFNIYGDDEPEQNETGPAEPAEDDLPWDTGEAEEAPAEAAPKTEAPVGGKATELLRRRIAEAGGATMGNGGGE